MTQDAKASPESGDTHSLLLPSSAYPVLDAEVQTFVDLQSGVNDEILDHRHPSAARAAFAKLQGRAVRECAVIVDDRLLPGGPTGSVAVRIVRPAGATAALPVVLFFHGGGWMVGDRDTHDRLVCEIACAVDAAVVFVDYSPSPEAVFPCQNEEAYAVLQYLATQAGALSLRSDSLALVGDGAGGNMVAAVAMLAKRRRGPAIALQVMFYPILSASTESPSFHAFENGPWLTAEAVKRVVNVQFPPDSQRDSSAFPLNANFTELEGLPAALIITAENDVLRDQGEHYARKLMQAGVAVTATRYLGTIHDFIGLNGLAQTPPTRAALAQACGALRMALHP